MKELVRKELREHVKVTLLGLLIFAVLLVHAYQTSAEALTRLIADSFGESNTLQPLLTNTLLTEGGFFCGIFGALLGWLQIRSEKHRDLWAFLVHRPIPRTRILWAKVIAGFGLYALAVGLPLLVLVIVVRAPGHVAAPFRWPMVLPVVGLFLAGLVCYFGGMLTGLRQARWYASRGLGLGAAVLAVFAVLRAAEFWQVLAVVAITGTILAVAVRGSFQSGGYQRDQPLAGRLALSAALFLGNLVVVAMVIGLVTSLILQPFSQNSPQYSSYYMTSAGSVLKVIHHRNGDQEIMDLSGKAVIDPETGRPLKWRRLSTVLANGASASVRSGEPGWYGYNRAEHYFNLWSMADRELWFLTRGRRLEGYSGTSRRFITTLQPPASGGGGRFLMPESSSSYFNSYEPPRTLASTTTLYRVDLAARRLHPLFTATNDNSILASVDARSGSTLVVTRRFIQLLGGDGAPIWRMPFRPWYPKYDRVTVYSLKEPDSYAVWLFPSYAANRKSGWRLPTHVAWISGRGGVAAQENKTLDLPPLPQPVYTDASERAFVVVVPPLLPMLEILFSRRLAPGWMWFSLGPAVVSLGIGWWLGRRYYFSIGAKVGWGVFHLLCGVPGLLAFLSVQEWPAREPCPHCSGLRTVDRERCEHCGAAFLPPEPNGTEIFAALESQTS